MAEAVCASVFCFYDIIRQDFLSMLFKINIQKILMNIFTKAWLEEVVCLLQNKSAELCKEKMQRTALY
jgi:hypothetical protein